MWPSHARQAAVSSIFKLADKAFCDLGDGHDGKHGPAYAHDDIVAVQCDLDRIEAQLNFLRATLIELLGDGTEALLRQNNQPEVQYAA